MTNSFSNVRVAALVSIGRHPKSNRARRAEQDARAVELGLKIAGDSLQMIHAGDPEETVLRSYLGMGISQMDVLSMDSDTDAIPALKQQLGALDTDIILTGMRAERGEGSGMLPYILAEEMDLPIVTGIADIQSIEEGYAEVLQALPRGQRRALRVSIPFVATVDMAALEARQSAFGPGQRAIINGVDSLQVLDQERSIWEESPAKKRPKRLKIAKAKTAAERFKAATVKTQGGSGKIMKNESSQEKAQAILDLLREEGVLKK